MRELVGPYRLFERLGAGAMGVAFRAEDRRNGSVVVLKILHEELADDADALARLRREARIGSELRHRNIARVLDAGSDGEKHYLVLEYVEGETLLQRLRREGRLSESETRRIALAVANALAAAEARGVVHRDIKPSNILLGDDGRVCVADFGVARLAGTTTVTRVGAFAGTPWYAAPEAASGVLDTRSDLYSLGVVMYHALTGRVPFDDESPLRVMHRHQRERPQVPALRRSARSLAPVVEQLLQKEARRRFQTASELVVALQSVTTAADLVDDATISEYAGSANWRRLPRIHWGTSLLFVAFGIAVTLIAAVVAWRTSGMMADDAPGAAIGPERLPTHTTPEPEATTLSAFRLHTVADGDTLNAIVRRYAGTEDDADAFAQAICNLNGLDCANVILNVGTTIVIPPTPRPIEPQAPYTVHEVRDGETVSSIAALYSIDPQYILASNDIIDGDFLVLGQSLLIPAGHGIVHRVDAHETLSDIATRYGVDPAVIVSFAGNGLSAADDVEPGRLIFVPGVILAPSPP